MELFNKLHINTTNIDGRVQYPDSININEMKAPTDESIKYMEEAHQKAIDNIISRVTVKDNIINGDIFLVNQPFDIDYVKLLCKFKINGTEFNVERQINRCEISFDEDISRINGVINDYGKTIMMWYALKMFSAQAFEKITGSKPDIDFLLKKG